MPTYKILGQSAPSSANTNVDLYSVPVSASAVVSTLSVTNTSSTTTADAYIYIRKATGSTPAAAATSNALFYNYAVPANRTFTFTIGVTLAAYDTITVSSDVANILTFQVFGSELP